MWIYTEQRVSSTPFLKHTRLRDYVDNLIQAQMLACQADKNTNPFPDLRPCDYTGAATGAREKLCS